MIFEAWLLILGISFIIFSFAWIEAIKKNNLGVIDVAWAGSFFVTVSEASLRGIGWWPRKFALAFVVSFWSLRLFFHLRGRVYSSPEDPRYLGLRKAWGSKLRSRSVSFFLIQALLVSALSFGFVLIANNTRTDFSLMEALGLFVSLAAVFGESTADRQLKKFVRQTENRGKTCRSGLWKYSRHPNYFFEWLFWCGLFILSLGAPLGWTTVYSPLLMLLFLWRVTGIPHTEAQALKSRGDDYRNYQASTSPFFLWPPKKLK